MRLRTRGRHWRLGLGLASATLLTQGASAASLADINSVEKELVKVRLLVAAQARGWLAGCDSPSAASTPLPFYFWSAPDCSPAFESKLVNDLRLTLAQLSLRRSSEDWLDQDLRKEALLLSGTDFGRAALNTTPAGMSPALAAAIRTAIAKMDAVAPSSLRGRARGRRLLDWASAQDYAKTDWTTDPDCEGEFRSLENAPPAFAAAHFVAGPRATRSALSRSAAQLEAALARASTCVDRRSVTEAWVRSQVPQSLDESLALAWILRDARRFFSGADSLRWRALVFGAVAIGNPLSESMGELDDYSILFANTSMEHDFRGVYYAEARLKLRFLMLQALNSARREDGVNACARAPSESASRQINDAALAKLQASLATADARDDQARTFKQDCSQRLRRAFAPVGQPGTDAVIPAFLGDDGLVSYAADAPAPAKPAPFRDHVFIFGHVYSQRGQPPGTTPFCAPAGYSSFGPGGQWNTTGSYLLRYPTLGCAKNVILNPNHIKGIDFAALASAKGRPEAPAACFAKLGGLGGESLEYEHAHVELLLAAAGPDRKTNLVDALCRD